MLIMKNRKNITVFVGVLLYAQQTVAESGNLYGPKQETMLQAIDKYIQLCEKLEHAAGGINFTSIRLLVFTHPCLIRCYNEMVLTGSIRPLINIWQAYKVGTVTNDRQKFVYELCYLIIIVFEQFFIKLAADFTGQTPQSLHDLFDKIELSMPLGDLVNILEQCYQELSNLMIHVEQQQQQQTVASLIPKKWLLIATLSCVFGHKAWNYWYSSHKRDISKAIVQSK